MSGVIGVKHEDECLDLSIKEFWLIVHYEDCDPGNEFEILHHSKLAENSWETLRRGVYVNVMFGNAKVQAVVVHVSDDTNYLETNLASITEEFLQEYYGETDLSVIMQKRRQKRRKHNLMTHCTHSKHIIKVMDKETQTDQTDNLKYCTLQNDYENLKTKYEQVQTVMTDFQKNMQKLFGNANEDAEGIRNNGPPFCQPSTSRTERQINGFSKLGIKKETLQFGPNGFPKNLMINHENSQTDSFIEESEGDEVFIGSGRTKVQKHVMESINWYNYSTATRKLLMCLFPRSTLATHSLTGKPSPAFIASDKQAKMRLDPVKIADIVETVSKKCGVTESLVRSAITTKCADENKMYRKRMEKRGKENCDVGIGEKNKKAKNH